MARCSRCGNSCADDIAVCPKCGAALRSTDVLTALDSLSGSYDSESSAFIHSESVVVFKGETRKEAVNRITKGKSRKAFAFGLAIIIVFAAFAAACATRFASTAKTPRAVDYTSSSPAGSTVRYNVNTLIPVVEVYYDFDVEERVVYCFARGEDGGYAVAGIPSKKLDTKYKSIVFDDDNFNGSSSLKLQGAVTAMEAKEKKDFNDTLASAGVQFEASNYINISPDTSSAVTGTILLLLALFVLGFGFMIWSIGFRATYRKAQKVKKAFDKGNF